MFELVSFEMTASGNLFVYENLDTGEVIEKRRDSQWTKYLSHTDEDLEVQE